jgi:trigger factor
MRVSSKEELLENSKVHLKVTVPKKEVKAEYDSLVVQFCSKVALKGFRRGKVPAEVMIRKFGDSIKSETTQNLIEKSLKEVFEKVEHKPLPYSLPSLAEGSKLEFDLDRPFSFEVTYDTYPRIELCEYRGLEIEEPIVTIGKEDIDRELSVIQEQNSIVMDKENATVDRGDTVTIDYVELNEESNEIEGTKREGFTFSVGSGYNLYKIDDDIVGMTKDEQKELQKEYPKDFEYSDLAGRTVKLRLKVTGVKEKKLPEIDDELAQDVSEKYKTLKDLRDDILKRLKEASQSRVREVKIKRLFEKIVANSKIPLPVSMVEQELNLRWNNFLRQFRSNENLVLQLLEKEGKTKDDLLEEWRPAVEQGLKTRLAEVRITEAENIEASDKEVDKRIAEEAERQGKDPEELREEYQKNSVLDLIKDGIQIRKLHDLLLESATVKKGEKVKFLDFMQGKD